MCVGQRSVKKEEGTTNSSAFYTGRARPASALGQLGGDACTRTGNDVMLLLFLASFQSGLRQGFVLCFGKASMELRYKSIIAPYSVG